MYKKEIAKNIVNTVKQSGNFYSTEDLIKKFKCNSKDFYDTFDELKLKNQITTIKLGTVQITENSYQIVQGFWCRFINWIKAILNNQTFAATLGAAIGMNLGGFFTWFIHLFIK